MKCPACPCTYPMNYDERGQWCPTCGYIACKSSLSLPIEEIPRSVHLPPRNLTSGTLTVEVVAGTKVDIFGWGRGSVGTRWGWAGAPAVACGSSRPDDPDRDDGDVAERARLIQSLCVFAEEVLGIPVPEWQCQLLMGGHQWRPCPKES
jgi:hypothetical protein